jgi:2-polyprenyl-3-methyl-5-hydroxy-6-metoxy-1,4-benzoquinol methylase
MTKCRFCKYSLEHIVVDLKNQPSANRLLSIEDLRNLKQGKHEQKGSLTTYICDNCSLVQLGNITAPEDLFTDDYVYYSSFSNEWVEHARVFVEEIISKFKLTSKSRVLEIGSNDGYLLQHFVPHNIPCQGIDPAGQAAKAAEEKGVNTIVGFFNKTTSQKIVQHFGACDLIIGNNVFAHVPKIREFINAIKSCLSEKGIVSLEFPHLASLVEYTQFDTIYDEHYFYHSIIALTNIFSDFNLKIIEVNELPTHGGSLRIFLTHEANHNYSISHSVRYVLNKELAMKLDRKEGFQRLQEKAELIRKNTLDFIKRRKDKGQKIIAFGAAAKGNVFLNYCGINSDDINCVVDDTPAKQGKFLPGSHIPVVAVDAIRDIKPDIIIILPWNFRKEICQRLSFVKEWEGQLVTFIPEIKIS